MATIIDKIKDKLGNFIYPITSTNAVYSTDGLTRLDNKLTSIDTNIAPDYSPTSTYAYGTRVIKDGLLYKCIIAITVAEAWNITKWQLEPVGTSLVNVSKDAFTVKNIGSTNYTGNLNVLAAGVVWCDVSATNKPVADFGTCTTILSAGTTYFTQVFTALTTGISYTRTCNGGTWQLWQQLAVERNWLNNAYSNKNMKMDYGAPLVTFTNGIGTITLSQTYNANSAAIINPLGGCWVENSGVSGNSLTITLSDTARAPINGQVYVKYHVMGY